MTVTAALTLIIVTIIYISTSIACGYALTENKQYGFSRILVATLGGLVSEVFALFIFFTYPFPTIMMVGTTSILTFIAITLGSMATYMLLFTFGEFLYNSTHKPNTDKASAQV